MCIMNILPLFTQGTIMDTYHNFTDLDTALVLVVLTIIAIAVYKLVHRFRKSSESAEDDYSNNESPSCSINEEDNFNKETSILDTIQFCPCFAVSGLARACFCSKPA